MTNPFGNSPKRDDSEVDADTSLAAVYARTSSQSQKQGYSLDEQVRQCLDRCQLHRWDVVGVYRDESESGKDTDRPMFQEMLNAAEKQLFDVLVVWKLDRLSRSLLHLVEVEADLREYDVSLHSVTEQIDTTTPAGRFQFRNIASAAEWERDMISDRTQMGLDALAADQKWPNDSPALGYLKRDDGRLAIEEDEADLVRRIFSQYVEKKSMPQVAFDLNEIGETTREGKDWTARAVGDILRNKLYIGRYSVGSVNEQIDEYQIVDEDLFERVTEIRHRFVSDSDTELQPMIPERKAKLVDRTIDSYIEFIK